MAKKRTDSRFQPGKKLNRIRHYIVALFMHLFGRHCWHKKDRNWQECCVCYRGRDKTGGGLPK